MSVTKIKTCCGLCHMACGMIVTKTDGVITDISADPDYPTSHGYLCPKAFSIPELVSSPQRLTKPLKKLPDGRQVEISWDEALDLAAEKLLAVKEKYGPNAVMRCSGSPVNYDARDGFNALFQAMGSGSATGAASQCHVPRNLGHLDVLGERGEPDFEHTDLIVIIGANPVASNRLGGYCAYPHASALIKAAQNRGCPVIVVDPIYSETAKLADRWIPLRCGTDAALLLAMINHIIENKLYDQVFVENYTTGFDQLSLHVKDMTPDWAAQITGIPADQIRELAETIARSPSATVYDGNGLDQYCNVVDSARSVAILSAITGNMDIPGGIVTLPFIPQARLNTQKTRCLSDEFPLMFELPFIAVKNALLRGDPDAPKAMVVHHANPVVTHADSGRTCEALSKLEYLIVDDIFPTETTKLADLVLPAACYFEHYCYRAASNFDYAFACISRPLATPPGEAKTVFEMEYALAQRMGLAENFPYQDDKTWIQHMLTPSGITFEQLEQDGVIHDSRPVEYRKYEKRGFFTPEKKVRLYSEVFEKHGYNPMPVYRAEEREEWQDLEQFPLRLTSRRPLQFVHSKLHNMQCLTRKHPMPAAVISKGDATARNISDGDVVVVTTPVGSGDFLAVIGDQEDGLLAIDFGWGNPTDSGTNMNALLPDDKFGAITGTTPNRYYVCQLHKK